MSEIRIARTRNAGQHTVLTGSSGSGVDGAGREVSGRRQTRPVHGRVLRDEHEKRSAQKALRAAIRPPDETGYKKVHVCRWNDPNTEGKFKENTHN